MHEFHFNFYNHMSSEIESEENLLSDMGITTKIFARKCTWYVIPNGWFLICTQFTQKPVSKANQIRF